MSPLDDSSPVRTSDAAPVWVPEARTVVRPFFSRISWDNLALWSKRLGLLMLTIMITNFVIRTLFQDLEDRDTLFIKITGVPDRLAGEGFGADNAAQTLWNGIQQIETRANTTPDQTHPALLQADSANTDLEKMAIPATDMSLGDLQELIRYLFPWLKPVLVTGSIEESGTTVTPDLWLNSDAIDLKPQSAGNDLTMAKRMLYWPGHEDNAAFQIMENIDQVTALAALNSYGKVAAASSELAKIQIDPENPLIWNRAQNLLGFTQIEQHRYQDAIDTFRRLGKFAPAYANLCYIYQDTNYSTYDRNLAESYCLQAQALDPRLESPHLHLGIFEKADADLPNIPQSQRAIDFRQALWQFAIASEVNPDSVSAHAGLADVLGDPGYAAHDYDCSIWHYQKALFKNPTYSIAMLGLANSYSAEGDWPDAFTWYAKALKQDPSLDPRGNTRLGKNPIAVFVADVDKIADPTSADRPALIKAAQRQLADAFGLLNALARPNPTLMNKISTEMAIIALPPEAAGVPHACPSGIAAVTPAQQQLIRETVAVH